jgi:hypothetical protein
MQQELSKREKNELILQMLGESFQAGKHKCMICSPKKDRGETDLMS